MVIQATPEHVIQTDCRLTPAQFEIWCAEWERRARPDFARYWDTGRTRWPRLRALDAQSGEGARG